MALSKSEISANHVYHLLQGNVFSLKPLFKNIQRDFENMSCDYILRQCKFVKDFENFLRNYSHLFIVENNKVARYCVKLETGQEAADKYFKEELQKCNHLLSIEKLRKRVAKAPEDAQYFIKTFYPEPEEFKQYLRRRPHMFHVFDGNIVNLTEKEVVEFFRKIVKQAKGVRYTKLRGSVGQAPEHVKKYINNQYPGNELKHFLENNHDVFRLDSEGRIYLVKQQDMGG